MSFQRYFRSPLGKYVLPLIHSFNVAAICALGVWHGYLFRVEHTAATPAWTLAAIPACAPCSAALPAPGQAADSNN